ncbi:alpha/beta fold hydrolase [Nonomuraea spiralis]|uniref:alpha/beta fold hydrolase n=1 Tax=Nonomuraea TaxID=83681 RepID=UPI0021ADD5FF|nr:alpha/beta hydrolase [Nonomuraea sp. WAC 01424]
MNDLVEPNIGAAFRGPRLGHFRDAPAFARFRNTYDQAMADLPEPDQSWDVETDFGTVRVYRFGTGDGVPLLLLPGRTASTPMWESNLAGLITQRPVYTVDLLGEPGLSVQTRAFASSADQASWLAELLDGLGLDRVHLVGVSIGGWSAFHLALRVPEKIASVSLLDPASLFGRITWKVVVVSLGSVVPFFPESWRRWLLSWISAGADASDDEPVANLISAGMRDFTAFLPPPTYPTDEQVAGVGVPVLALIAGRSIIHNPRKAAERARRLLPRGVVELWPDASHAINGEFPERVNSRILAFADEIDSADRPDGTGRAGDAQ